MKILGRTLTLTEKKAKSEVEVALSILHWAVRKAAKYTTYHQHHVILMLRKPEHFLIVKDASVHTRLRAKVLDLLSYGVDFSVSMT